MAVFLKTLVLVTLCLFSPLVTSDLNTVDHSKLLNVPVSHFVYTVKSTMDNVQQVITTMSNLTEKTDINFRLSNATADCRDLLDLSLDHLSSTLAPFQNSHGEENNISPAEIKATLSGVLINQDTCQEGFDGTNNTVHTFAGNAFNKITTSVHHILDMVKKATRNTSKGRLFHGGGGGQWHGKSREFPSWLKSSDRKLIKGTSKPAFNVVVAADGTGNFTSIMEAISSAPEKSKHQYFIYVKQGLYKEYVEIGKKKTNIVMIGDGMDRTIISGNRSHVDGWSPYRTATFGVKGKGFIARDMTFENTAGPCKHQAVAYRSDSDGSTLSRCAFRGYQDTLYPHSRSQFYVDCFITGTVDFIFGFATAFFYNCRIVAQQGLVENKNTITANGRRHRDSSGFFIQNCQIWATPNVTSPTYLGRPWKNFSRTFIMKSYISGAIRPEGWLPWNGSMYLDTLFYLEYDNFGPGARLAGRVKWPGYHIINGTAGLEEIISGNTWLP